MSYGSPGLYVSGAPQGGIPPVPFQQPTKLFRYGEQSIWSTQFFDASAGALAVASSSFRLFSTPIGQTGQGFQPLSIAETSLKEGGRIPSGVSFDVFGISCHIYAGDDAAMPDTNFGTPTDSQTLISNLVNIQNSGVLSWDFLQTTRRRCVRCRLPERCWSQQRQHAEWCWNRVALPEARRGSARPVDLLAASPIRQLRSPDPGEHHLCRQGLPTRLLQERHRNRLILHILAFCARLHNRFDTFRPLHPVRPWRAGCPALAMPWNPRACFRASW